MENRLRMSIRRLLPESLKVFLRPFAKMTGTTSGEWVYQGEEADCFLISYPRSGNTWMRHMLTTLHPGVQSGTGRDIQQVIPNVDGHPDISATPRPRVLKTHSLYKPMYRKVIYLLRDGRDATYSYYRFCRLQHGYTGSLLEFLRDKPYVGFTWADHVKSWLRRVDNDAISLVRYEDMLLRPEEQLARVTQFLDWETTDSRIGQAVAESTIEKNEGQGERWSIPRLCWRGWFGCMAHELFRRGVSLFSEEV